MKKPEKNKMFLKAQDLGLEKESVSPVAFSTCVRSLLLNARQGTVACLGRSDVSFSGKKPFKQKGTGRARAGDARSPLWRKGGVIFGPQKRVRTTTVPQKIKQAVVRFLLWKNTVDDRLCCLPWEGGDTPKTAHAAQVLSDAGLANKKVVILLSHGDVMAQASWGNLPNVLLVTFDEINALNLVQGDYIVVFEKDLDTFKQVVAQWH